MLLPDGRFDTLGDFDPREDVLDLSFMPRLYGPESLRITSTATGARVTWADEVVFVTAHDRQPIAPAVLAAAIRIDVGRLPPQPPLGLVLGTEGADILEGWGGRQTLRGLGGDDVLIPGPGTDLVDGGAGRDMVSYADAASGAVVDLGAGTARVGAEADTLVSIEDVVGTAFADQIKGSAGANRLSGGAGDDWFTATGGGDAYDGGVGRDMVSYVGAPAAVTVNLATGQGTRGQALGDTYTGIERVTGSVFSDLFHGSSGADDFRGSGGDDWFVGSGGGRDVYDGGTGGDTVAYSASAAGVAASLATGTGTAGDAASDVFVFIENLTGSSHGDTLTGDANRNTLRGMYGQDTLFGGEGNDRLEGGGSDDLLDGGGGWDVAVFSGARAAYRVTTAAGVTTVTHLGGSEGTDTLRGIEALAFADGLVSF